jgi:hypothetical protein
VVADASNENNSEQIPQEYFGPERIAPDLLPFARAIDTLIEDPENTNEHGPASIAGLRDSLARFGQRKLIVADPSGVVRARNGTLIAARDLGWKRVAAIVMPSVEAAKAFGVADNRSGETSEWDRGRVTIALAWLKEQGASVRGLGWTDAQVAGYLKALEPEGPIEVNENTSMDKDPESQPEKAGKVFATTLEFANEGQQAEFFAFLSDLKTRYPEIESPGKRLIKWVETI